MRPAKSTVPFHFVYVLSGLFAASAYYGLFATFLASKVPSGCQLFIDEHLGVGALDVAFLVAGLTLVRGDALESLLGIPLLTEEDRAQLAGARGMMLGPTIVLILMLVPFTLGGLGVVAIGEGTVSVWAVRGVESSKALVHHETCAVRELRLERHEKSGSLRELYVTPAGYVMRDFVHQRRLRDCIQREMVLSVLSNKRIKLTMRQVA